MNASQDADAEMVLQNNDNESSLIEAVTVSGNDLPVIKQEPHATVCPEIINQAVASSAASQQNDVQNTSASIEALCDIKEENDDDLSETSLETIDGSPDFPSEAELQEIIGGTDIQEIDQPQAPLVSVLNLSCRFGLGY